VSTNGPILNRYGASAEDQGTARKIADKKNFDLITL
jgi:hypothetical protein